MRPIDKTNPIGKTEYHPYGDAKPQLITSIGSYCSYCERHGYSTALDVEHIEDKHSNPDKEYLWSNFLLACKNCNSIKGNKSVNFNEIILPHLNNTFLAINYLESGYIKINPEFQDKKRAENLISLIGLDRRPGHPLYSPKDERWNERKKAWTLASRYLTKYEKEKTDEETIVDLAKANGFFSIWMHIFKNHSTVLEALINAFPGTEFKSEIKSFLGK